MGLLNGIHSNLKGLVLGLRTPCLLMLGILRFFVVVLLAVLLSGLILFNHQEILGYMWTMPESGWLVVVWKAVSWILSIFIAGISALLAYLIAQVLFCVFIMDYMSRITERIASGNVSIPQGVSMLMFFIYLVRQEIPRAIIPVALMLLLMITGFLTPAGPVIAAVSAVVAAVFLAWDNTDLVPARRMYSFKDRLGYLKKNLLFHLGFGLWFLIPFANILFLSFAPVGATLYYIENEKGIE